MHKKILTQARYKPGVSNNTVNKSDMLACISVSGSFSSDLDLFNFQMKTQRCHTLDLLTYNVAKNLKTPISNLTSN